MSRIALLLLVVTWPATAWCADPLAFPLDEPPLAARLAGIDPQWNISLKTAGKIRVVRAADLSYWGRYRDVEGGPQILLIDGSTIRSDVLQLDERQLVLGDATGLGRGQWDESALPRAAIAAILWQPPADSAERDKLLGELLRENGANDRLQLLGGESLSGALVSAPLAGRFAPEDVKPGSEVFELARREQPQPLKIPASRVIAVRLAGGIPTSKPAGEMAAWLGLSDGSLIRVGRIGVKGDAVTLHLAAGGQLLTTLTGRKDAALKLWDEVTYLEPVGQRVTWLSDRPGPAFRHIPFLSVERKLGLDQNVLGGRLRSGGAVCRKGLGMPSASRLAMDVSGYRRFEAEIAIDDSAQLQGSVIVKVLLEESRGRWKAGYEGQPIRGGDLPRQISVDLAGASHLALLVDFADRGDTCDWADWLHARLIK